MSLNLKQVVASSIIVGTITGIICLCVMLPITTIFTEPIDKSIEYDILACTLENKFLVIEDVALGGAGAGGLGNSQVFLDKETFLNLSKNKTIYYAENILIDGHQYQFTQTYWSKSEEDLLLVYEKKYTPPMFCKIIKGEHELIYYRYDPFISTPVAVGLFFGGVCFLILFFFFFLKY